jgi:C-terminal processing protease CtpA/Prc
MRPARENLGVSIQTFGETSYGKGIGQIYVETPLGGYMAITVLHPDPMRAPSYHGFGIAPDTYFANGGSAIDKAWNLARSTITSPVLAKKSITPNLTALEWNRQEKRKNNIPLLRPIGPGRPFPLH